MKILERQKDFKEREKFWRDRKILNRKILERQRIHKNAKQKKDQHIKKAATKNKISNIISIADGVENYDL